MKTNEKTETNEAQHLLTLLEQFKVVMLVQREGKQLHSRPMTIAKREGSKVWFLTTLDSTKTRALEVAPRVQLTCQSPTVYLSIAGHAALVKDRAVLESLWSEADKLWFPQGLESPDLVALSVELLEGEYWDQSGFNAIKFIFEAARAYVSGQEMDLGDESHAKVTLKAAGA